jgi:HPt (histidine-containing phosphotransfer) domain-containing protein
MQDDRPDLFQAVMKTLLASLFGKYRDLVLAIGIFLVIDAGVSAINITTSRLIEIDAERINTAGLLRTYSQQLTKALLTLDMDLRNGNLTQSSLAEISEARLGFDDARQALERQLAQRPALPLIEPDALREQAQDKLNQVLRTWEPIEREVGPLIVNGDPDADTTASAVQKAVTRNNRLTRQASDLTDSLEEIARQKTASVRTIQTLAIALALLNFAFIIFKFIGRLAASDRQTTLAREETGRILGSVREGLFLLTSERTVGQQRSNSLDRIFGQQLQPGADFNDFLLRLTSPENAEAARDYIDLLFNQKMKQNLLEQLNPLVELELLPDHRQRKGPSHLTFEFNQVREAGQVVALLVTVFDVSQKVRLEHQLAGAEARADNEIALLLGVLDHNPREVATFLQRARDTLQLINADLQNIQPGRQSYPQLVNSIARIIHGMKGEAGTLGCSGIVREAHAFEGILQPLRGRDNIGGDDLIPVAVGLSSLLSEIIKLEAVVKRIQHFANSRNDAPPGDPLGDSLRRIEQYAHRVAGDLDKQIRFETATPRLAVLPPRLANILREAVPQLVRNAIAHGIESPDERQRLGKPASGLIRIELSNEADGTLTMTVHDDGRGLSAEHLRSVLASRGRHTPETLAAMSDAEIVASVFEPGFSSLDQAHPHAGRGDGLAVVKEALRSIGGRLRINSRPNSHTRFTMQIKPA